jgi:hypothetical protein
VVVVVVVVVEAVEMCLGCVERGVGKHLKVGYR